MRSTRTIDVGCPAAHGFAVLSDRARIDEWSTLFTTVDHARDLTRGEQVRLRWHWPGHGHVVNATVDLGDDPFRVRYEGTTDDGERFRLEQRVVPAAAGARVELTVDVEPPAGVAAVHELQRELDAHVDRMTARVYVLLERLRAPCAGRERDDLLPRRSSG